MRKINKEVLVNGFVLNEKSIEKLNTGLNKVILNYFWKNNIDSIYINDVIKSIVKNSFYTELEGENINDIIIKVSKYNSEDFVRSLVDTHDDKLINSYMIFESDIDIYAEDDEIIKELKEGQYKMYNVVFENIREAFIWYLKWLNK